MKTTLISVITFIIGLFAGFCSHLFRPAEFIDSSRTADGLRPKAHLSALPKTGAVAALHTDDDKATSSDPFAEWEAALKENKLKDASLRGDLIERMIALNPQRAWQMLMDSGLHVSLHDITTVAQHWSRKNPAEAATFGLTLTDPLQRPAFLRHVLTLWFLEKPQAFAAWFEAQPADAELVSYINPSNMTYQDGVSTLADLDAMIRVSPPYASFPDVVGRHFHAIWKQPQYRQAATNWLQNLTDEEVRDTTWKYLISTVSDDDPQAAAAMLNEIRGESPRREATSAIAAHLAQRDPQAALAYAAALPDEKTAVTAWQSALCTWLVSDPKPALDFIRQNRRSITPDMLGPVDWELSKKMPIEAIKTAVEFPESVARTRLINGLVSSWRNRQPKEAKKWLESEESSLLPAVDLARFRSAVKDTNANYGHSNMTTTIDGRRVKYSY